MRTIGLTVIMTDLKGRERQGELVIDASDNGITTRKRLHELVAASLAAMDLWRGTDGWATCQFALYLELIDVDDRLGGFIKLRENMAELKAEALYKRIEWKNSEPKEVE